MKQRVYPSPCPNPVYRSVVVFFSPKVHKVIEHRSTQAAQTHIQTFNPYPLQEMLSWKGRMIYASMNSRGMREMEERRRSLLRLPNKQMRVSSVVERVAMSFGWL